MSEWDFNRRWRTVLWLLIGTGLVLFFAVVWDQVRWRRASDEGVIRWQRGTETRLDSNGDGRVDEISFPLRGTNEFLVKRDTDGDGMLDLQYKLRHGIAVDLEPISEPVPRQK
jgi:hypothetical protein